MDKARWKPLSWADGCCGEGEARTEAEDDGAFDGDEARCTACGRPGTVSADEDGAHVSWHDEPKCECWWCTREREDATLRAQLADAQARLAVADIALKEALAELERLRAKEFN